MYERPTQVTSQKLMPCCCWVVHISDPPLHISFFHFFQRSIKIFCTYLVDGQA